MGTWDRIRAALRREKADVDEALAELEQRGNAAMDRRERELWATPEEKLAMEQERAADNDAAFDEVRRKIEGRGGSLDD
jgi:hypothetical protein